MNEIQTVTPQMVPPLSAVAIREQVNLIQSVMKEVMQDGQHFGVVPGCGKKPTLLKPGAEKLAMTFRLRPIMDNDRDIRITQMDNGHREITVYCHIYNMNGLELATGIGSCSTMESKYRYRNSSDYEITGQPIPKDSKEKKAEYRKQGFGMKQIDGVWEWVKYKAGEKSDNPDIADNYNTVLKMAKKRAFVDGILSATGASDIFTQDIEDLPEAHVEPAKPSAPTAQSPQRKSAQEPTTEELERKAAEAKARLQEGQEQAKSEPAKPQTPSDGVKTAKGMITNVGKPNAGGYVSISIDGYQREDGRDQLFSTKDETILDTISDRVAAGKPIGVEYRENANPKFAASILGLVSVE